MSAPPLLEVKNLCKAFRINGSSPLVLRDVGFMVRAGEVLAVLGPSGCGKTTLLSILAGFLAPDRGGVLLEGRPVGSPGPDRAVVFQEDALFPWLTVRENLEMGLKGRVPGTGMGRARRRERVGRFLAMVGLTGHGGYLPRELSGGMKQRVALARVLILEPRVLLMDEPFASLDAQTRADMHRLLVSLKEELDQTVVLVTHDLEEAVKLADRVLVMSPSPGSIVEEVRVDLPRPRDSESVPFNELKRGLYAALCRGGTGEA